MLWLWLACRSDAVVEGTPPVDQDSSPPIEYIPPENVSSQDREWDLEGLSNAVTDALAVFVLIMQPPYWKVIRW